MRLLLDTHIWIWSVLGDKRLLRTHIAAIEKMPFGSLTVSAVSVWEIAMLVHYGRLRLDYSPRVWIETSLEKLGIDVIALNADIALESYALPGIFHGDLADRIIVATARQKGLTLMTQDKAILAYARQGHIMAFK